MTIICLVISPFLPIWLNGDISIHQDASTYFTIISIPFFLRSAVLILSSPLRGVKDMKTPMLINVCMNIINIVLNFLLIYPNHNFFGIIIPGMNLGVRGAAIATAISFTIGGLLMIKCYYQNSRFNFHQTGFHYHPAVMKECLTIGIPVVLERGVICLGHVAFTSLIATLGGIPFAAHSIAIQAEQAFYIPGYGFQSAAATMVGHSLGERNTQKIKHITFLICTMTFSLMFVAGILLFITAPWLMAFFTENQHVILLGTNVLCIVSVSEPIYGILVILEGTFNGLGDTKAPFVYALMTMWGIRILGTWIMIYILHLGLNAVWIMMVCDNVARCCLLLYRFTKQRWLYLLNN